MDLSKTQTIPLSSASYDPVDDAPPHIKKHKSHKNSDNKINSKALSAWDSALPSEVKREKKLRERKLSKKKPSSSFSIGSSSLHAPQHPSITRYEAFKLCQKRDNDYRTKLNLSDNDLAIIRRWIQPANVPLKGDDPDPSIESFGIFVGFQIDNKTFFLYVHDTASHSDYSSKLTLHAYCYDDDSLNQSFDSGKVYQINLIPEECHQKMLDKMDESVRRSLHEHIQAAAANSKKMWAQALQNSREILDCLHFSQDDLKKNDVLKIDGNGNPRRLYSLDSEVISIEGKKFQCHNKLIYSGDYEETSWSRVIQVTCKNDASLNTSIGGGTSRFNTIPQVWHNKLLRKLREMYQARCPLFEGLSY